MGRKKTSKENQTKATNQIRNEEELPLKPKQSSELSAKDEAIQSGPSPHRPHHKKKHHKHEDNHQSTSPAPHEKCAHFTWEEIGRHDTKDDAWVVIEDSVYDVTKLIPSHPGGPKAIEQRAGKDATKRFHKGHHPYHVLGEKLPQLIIGRVHMDSCIESWQRERKTGKMDLFCVVLLSLTLLGSLIYLATS